MSRKGNSRCEALQDNMQLLLRVLGTFKFGLVYNIWINLK